MWRYDTPLYMGAMAEMMRRRGASPADVPKDLAQRQLVRCLTPLIFDIVHNNIDAADSDARAPSSSIALPSDLCPCCGYLAVPARMPRASPTRQPA